MTLNWKYTLNTKTSEHKPRVVFPWGHVNPIGPPAGYDEGKRIAGSETLAYSYQLQDSVDIRVVRYLQYTW